MVVNKPFVALLCALTAMATVNMVIATGPMIQKVFVTNWPTNQNVTVTNPPTVVVNTNVTIQPKAPLEKELTGAILSIKSSRLLPRTDFYFRLYNSGVDAELTDQWATNYTFDVRGYQRLSLAASVRVPLDSLVNQSAPMPAPTYGLPVVTTITYFNISTAFFIVGYSFPGHSALMRSEGTGLDPNGDSAVQVWGIGGVSSLGPLVKVDIYYYRILVSGFYYGSCFYFLPSPDCGHGGGLISGGLTSATLQSENTSATVTVYSTG